MSAEKAAFIVINVVGGSAVLASYALWLANPSNDGAALWGGIAGVGRTCRSIAWSGVDSLPDCFGLLLASHARGDDFASRRDRDASIPTSSLFRRDNSVFRRVGNRHEIVNKILLFSA